MKSVCACVYVCEELERTILFRKIGRGGVAPRAHLRLSSSASGTRRPGPARAYPRAQAALRLAGFRGRVCHHPAGVRGLGCSKSSAAAALEDHSRVKMQKAENDSISASLVDIEEEQRSYFLTHGPLPGTGCHF